MPIERFGFDAAIVFSDILVVAEALGVEVAFSDKGPMLAPIGDAGSLSRSESVSRKAFEPVYETLTRVRARLDASVSLFGFAGGPWTLACYLAAGRGGDEQKAAKLWAYRDRPGFDRLMECVSAAVVDHLVGQLQAGADLVQIFDSWAGGLSEPLFRRYVLDNTRAVVAAVRRHVPGAKIVGFPRGASLEGYRLYAEETGVDAVSLDTAVPMAWAASNLSRVVLQGNLDPLALVAGGAALEGGVARILTAMAGQRFVFNLGHGILPETPVENVERLVELVRGR